MKSVESSFIFQNQDYTLWCDLRALEERVGHRWLTHESDDLRWESYRRQMNLSPYQKSGISPLVEKLVDLSDSNSDSKHKNGTNFFKF